MGLLRIAVVVAAGVALLPSDRESQDKLYDRAASATTWAMTFCDRNTATCEQGAQLWTKFVAKAEFGAKVALDLARDRYSGDVVIGNADSDGKTSPLPQMDLPARTAPAVLERRGGTLRPDDLKPAWRGKASSKGSI